MRDPELARLAVRFGRTLRLLRLRRGLTQENMEQFGITYKYYQRLERPGRRPANVTFRTLLLLARAFRVPVHRLLK